MPQQGEIAKGLITDLTKEGEGFLRQDGYAVFVPNALPGDTITYKLEKAGTKFGHGKLLSIDIPSPARCKENCPYAKECGGCQMQSLSYPAQLAIKQKHVQDALARIGGLTVQVSSIVGYPNEALHYRNKITFPLRKEGVGMYALHSHTFLPIENCLLAPENTKEILAKVREITSKIEQNHLPNQITIRWNSESTQLFILLQGKENRLYQEEIWIKKLSTISSLAGIAYLKKTKALSFSDEEEPLEQKNRLKYIYGKKNLEDSIGFCKVQVSPLSFYQINPQQRLRLYEEIANLADLKGTETVLDAYCGAGTIGLFLHRQAKRIIGVEVIPQAIEDAKVNMQLNQCTHADFVCGKAEELVPKWQQEGLVFDLAVLDPPRKGCDIKLLEAISVTPRIIYVSCDPATLARDLAFLAKKGYQVESAHPFDLFPNTMHVETVCLLSKLQANKHIEINLDMSELDLTAAESKATYEEIKEYVLEHSGLKVSHLYIAQVKRKHGIIERANYNLPKNADSKQPICPPEKEKAITEALKFFGMI